jgi:hypothetical protein
VEGLFDFSSDSPTIDPQNSWYRIHRNILDFLHLVPGKQKLRIRGEDLLSNPEEHLPKIARWMGLGTDPDAIERMKHPEHSPYACFGPYPAHLGNDPNFMLNPILKTSTTGSQSLEGPLSWRKDGAEFSEQVRELARQFGYK